MVMRTTPPNKHFSIVPNASIFKLTGNQLKLYAYYIARSNNDGQSWATNKRIAADLSLGIATVKRIKKELIELGYILSKEVIVDGAKVTSTVTVLYPDADESIFGGGRYQNDTEGGYQNDTIEQEPINNNQYTIVTNEQNESAETPTNDNSVRTPSPSLPLTREPLPLTRELVDHLYEFNVENGLYEGSKWSPSERDQLLVSKWISNINDTAIWAYINIAEKRFQKARRSGTTNKQYITLSYIDKVIEHYEG